MRAAAATGGRTARSSAPATRGGGPAVAIVAGLAALVLLISAATPAAAQDERSADPQSQEPERPDPKREALERLRALNRPLIALPDTSVTPAADDAVDGGADDAEAEDDADAAARHPRADRPIETADPPPARVAAAEHAAREPDAARTDEREAVAPAVARDPAVPVRQDGDTIPGAQRRAPPPAQQPAGQRAAVPARDGTPPGGAQDPSRAPRAPGKVGGGTPGDSIMQVLRQLEGYTVLEYEGAGARFTADRGRLELQGRALVDRQGQSMEVDSLLVYSSETAVVCGYGKPVLAGDGAPVESELVCYDMDRQTGMARDARTTFQEGATWFVHSREAYPVGSERLYSHDARFTSCDLEEPHYHFGARSVKIVHDDIMVARNVTLRFADVPVFWLPFMVQSLKSGRRSGLLTPRFSVNDIARTRSNYDRRIEDVGFYWAISDYLGAEVALDWYSGNWTALDGRLDYNWREQFLNGNFSFRRFWTAQGGDQIVVNTGNSWRPSERTSLNLSANYASSSSFVQRNSFDPEELMRSIDSNASVTHRFDWGNLNLGARRRQHLTDDRVDMTLPSVSLSLSPVTFFRASPMDARWYNNATWSGSGSFDNRTTSTDLTRPGATHRDTRHFSGNVRSSLNIGNLTWGQSARIEENVLHAKPALEFMAPGDPATIMEEEALPRELTQRITWDTGLSYRLPLIGATTLTPSVSATGQLLRSPLSDDELVAGPIQPNFGARLSTEIFGFWPGVGPYSRFRHRLSPSVTYSYRPPVDVTERQREVFGMSDLAEHNQIIIGLTQTFEAQYREDAGPAGDDRRERPLDAGARDVRRRPVPPPPDEPADADELDADAAQDADADAAGIDARTEDDEPLDDRPRRLPRPRTITLLALNTSAVTYDFVRARERGWWHTGSPGSGLTDAGRQYGFGWTTTQLTNSVRSDLLQGFSLRFTHDLFREEPATEPGGQPTRTFAPHLQSVNASFSLDANSWIFRVLGLAGALAGASRPGEETAVDPEDDDAFDVTERTGGSITRRGRGFTGTAAGAGPWRASLDFSMTRPRDPQLRAQANQLLRGNMSFRPTENWNVRWSTAYSFTHNEFQTHVLTMTRDLHRWEAHFDFIKAPNGNFSFQFRVSLRDNPDVKFDYHQRDSASPIGPQF